MCLIQSVEGLPQKEKRNSMKDITGSVRKTGIQRQVRSKHYINIKFTEVETVLGLCKRVSLFLGNTNRKDLGVRGHDVCNFLSNDLETIMCVYTYIRKHTTKNDKADGVKC